MISCTLIRRFESDQGTFGVLAGPGIALHTAELPWRDNRTSLSRITAGEYLCVPRRSRAFGEHYHLVDVRGRSWILIHAGNWAGDRERGLRSDTYGCILLGTKCGVLAGQQAVLCSRSAVREFLRAMGGQPFKLNIVEECHA